MRLRITRAFQHKGEAIKPGPDPRDFEDDEAVRLINGRVAVPYRGEPTTETMVVEAPPERAVVETPSRAKRGRRKVKK